MIPSMQVVGTASKPLQRKERPLIVYHTFLISAMTICVCLCYNREAIEKSRNRPSALFTLPIKEGCINRKETHMTEEEKSLYLKQLGRHLYQVNDDVTYDVQPLVNQNSFIQKQKDTSPIPTYEQSKSILPALVWDRHEETIACYNKAWEIAFSNLRSPQPDDGMVSNYIDSAFNDFLFMWDSAFITMFGKYGSGVFSFQKTLDNFYANQHKDGYICRAICEKVKGDRFHRYDPAGTGPNILAWAEWESYEITGDIGRIKAVLPVLLSYHMWLEKNRTWMDGTYWSTGWACGMDNQPRLQPEYSHVCSHGHMVWADACIQQIISAKYLLRMADLVGDVAEFTLGELRAEIDALTTFVNEKLWDEETAFYYDLWKNGQKNMVKSIGAYWALLADIVPADKLDAFIAHLSNPEEFARPHSIPTLSADHPSYSRMGNYWCGGVWAPANYMVFKGLVKNGYDQLAHDIALNHVQNVTQVFCDTDSIWENYAPETIVPGQPAKRDFVGWTGLSPIAVTIEHVFGIQSYPEQRKIVWKIQGNVRHGVLRYPFREGTVDLICPAHKAGEKVNVSVNSTVPVTVEVIFPDGTMCRHC